MKSTGAGVFLTEVVKNVKFIYFGINLISIEYNNGTHKTTFKEDGTFFSTVVHEPEPNRYFVYYHISGNEYGGLYSVSDQDVFVTESSQNIYNWIVPKTNLMKKINFFRGLIRNQTTISISEEILQILKE